MTVHDFQTPDVRFHLPPGPPVKPKRWQRSCKWPIRIASVIVVLAALVAGTLAVVEGFHQRSTMTAVGGVAVDCGTRAVAGSIPVAFGDSVAVFDASSGASPRDEPLAVTRLSRLAVLTGDTCLAEFEIRDLPVVDAYVVRIGDSYRQVVGSAALRGGYLFA
ncbi:hypothetical protein L5I01_20740 [Gordonia sp. HY442]|uniref:hypothetical protein n=1 Tax=Gordonia zhenghanii TaxID=2911516 RepID=UPI001F1F04CB|nr:hypothetical protein [Gordonia zhenghanii]MCF8605785.1 hypothetical protein [Gordonia zhenghanii]